jgi:group I intron endonuclease
MINKGGGYMEAICGIYCIENLINHKKYVGQSIDIHHRWKDHKRELNGNRHRNEYLQRAWNKYEEINFHFYILEECDMTLLDEREVYYIEYFDCLNNKRGYNLELGGNANKVISSKTREKMSKSAKARSYGGKNSNALPVYCPQLDMTFGCVADVEREGFACASCVRSCLKGKRETAGTHPVTGEKLTWFDAKDTKTAIRKERKYKQHGAIYCIELDRVFEGGPSQVDREGVASRTCVARCLRGERKSAGKHPITGEKLHWKTIEVNNA